MSISPEQRYPRPRLAAQRTDRLNNKLDRFMLDGSTAESLSNDDVQVGLLVGRCLKMGDTVRTLRNLDYGAEPISWLILTHSYKLADRATDIWRDPETPDSLRNEPKDGPFDAFVAERVVIGTVESVARQVRKCGTRYPVAGLFLLDPPCVIHKARGSDHNGSRIPHDRPQVVADLRNRLGHDSWRPPLFILTECEPKGVVQRPLCSAYCLDTVWYLDGQTLFTTR